MSKTTLSAIISLGVLTIATSLFLYFSVMNFDDTPIKQETILKPNNIAEESAELTIVTVGERIEDDRAFFIQWEGLTEAQKELALLNQNTFIFSVDAFTNKHNQELIQTLIEEQKTVLFYGYRMKVDDILSSANNILPFYEIDSSQTIYYYTYGIGYSEKHEQMIPLAVLGNFSKSNMDEKITDYLIDYN